MRSCKRFIWTDDMVGWLKDNYPHHQNQLLLKMFNEKFGLSMSMPVFKRKANNLHITKAYGYLKGIPPRKGYNPVFSHDELQWIKSYAGEITYAEMAELFEEKFERKVKAHQLRNACVRNGSGFIGDDVKFRRKQQVRERLPVGSTKVLNGYVYIKFRERKVGEKMHVNWKPLARYLYEKNVGPIPEGCVITFLDGDKNNYEISNLFPVCKGTVKKMDAVDTHGNSDLRKAWVLAHELTHRAGGKNERQE